MANQMVGIFLDVRGFRIFDYHINCWLLFTLRVVGLFLEIIDISLRLIQFINTVFCVNGIEGLVQSGHLLALTMITFGIDIIINQLYRLIISTFANNLITTISRWALDSARIRSRIFVHDKQIEIFSLFNEFGIVVIGWKSSNFTTIILRGYVGLYLSWLRPRQLLVRILGQNIHLFNR